MVTSKRENARTVQRSLGLKPAPTPTTAQQLGSIIKSARDIMHKDKGLNGDLDRLPMLTWIMFLKFLDDMEQIREDEAALANERFQPAIEAPYRWRDWPDNDDNMLTGDELIAFINNEETTRPDGARGPGLFAYLRNLQGASGGDRRNVIATVFRGIVNRMINGYLLRDIINKVNGIHFTSSEEIHTLGHLYESMLKEMRDAAGDSGEFYTPRAVVRFMVEVINPRLGEIVLDPASGTGGFLVEAYRHLEQQCQTVQDRQLLQQNSISGGEAKSLPYLLAQMNLLLHGLEAPQIDPGNSLRFPLREVGDRERVDVILTNPPFGGEEEKSVLSNFQEDKQTSETALLFLQLIMRKLRRAPRPGRAGVVVPNGTLFGDGVCARIKEELLKDFNLHTIVRLPNGVFAPYTSIPTNLLFFDRTGPTRWIWYYEQPLPNGRKNYTKTQTMQFEEFRACLDWWNDREENEYAWRVHANDVLANGCNLDIKNPNNKQDLEHLPPEQIVDDIFKKEQRRIVARIEELATKIEEARGLRREAVEACDSLCRSIVFANSSEKVMMTPMRDLVMLREPDVVVRQDENYLFAGVYCFGKGVFKGQSKSGIEFSYNRLTRLRTNNFVYPKLMAWEGALGIVPPECDGLVVSPEFPVFEVDEERVLPETLDIYFRTPSVWPTLSTASTGTNVRRRRLNLADFLNLKISLPSMQRQELLREVKIRVDTLKQLQAETQAELNALMPSVLDKAFRGELV